MQPCTIPLCVPDIAGNEWRYLQACLDGNWVSSAGPQVGSFERAFAAWLGVSEAVAVMNGTAALHVALMLAGVGAGDEVLVSDFTFIAPVNAIRYCGAHPVLVDAEAESWQMDPARVAEFLRRDCVRSASGLVNRQTGRRIGAILPVHILGHPVALDGILSAAAAHGLPVIEDAAESLGGSWQGRKLGTLGRIGCFSFNGNKLMTTGGGGMVVTADAALARRARHLTTQAKEPIDGGVHSEVGYNYRLTGLQAAFGEAQLERIGALMASKRRVAAAYANGLAGLPGIAPMPELPGAENAFWLYTIRIDPKTSGVDAATLGRRLAAAGIETRRFWQPMHLSPAHRGAQVLGGAVSERLWGELLSLPSSCGLTEDAQAQVIAALRREVKA